MATPAIQRVKSRILYRGRVADLSLDTYRAGDGRTFARETIRHPASVVILPVAEDGRILLIRQFRHAVGRFIDEIPAGTSEPGESLLSCAKRELAEETGHSARRWKRLCEFYPAPGISTERMVLYRAEGLARLREAPAMDKDEFITLRIVPAQKALAMVLRNQILDAKTIIGILWGHELVRVPNRRC